MSIRTTAAALLVLLAAGHPARANFLVIGTNPTTELAVPFGEASDGLTDPSNRYQQVFNSNLFGGPITISALTLYTQGQGGGGAFNPVTYNFYLSTTSRSVGGLDPSNFDSNLGTDTALFASVSPTGAASPTWTIGGTTPFLYDPSRGNLLLDIRIPNQRLDASFLGASFDGQANFGTTSSSAHNFGSGDPASGLSIGVTFSAVPEPTSLAMVLIGSGCVFLIRRSRAA